MRPAVRFFFEFVSPYSCLAAHEIDARVDSAGGQVDWQPIDIRQIWQSYFSGGLPISTVDDLAKCVRHLEIDAQAIADYAGRSEASAALQANNRAAIAAGCFGIPWFTCAGESFFCQDRINHLVA